MKYAFETTLKEKKAFGSTTCCVVAMNVDAKGKPVFIIPLPLEHDSARSKSLCNPFTFLRLTVRPLFNDECIVRLRCQNFLLNLTHFYCIGEPVLTGANLGDSGFLVIRGGYVCCMTADPCLSCPCRCSSSSMLVMPCLHLHLQEGRPPYRRAAARFQPPISGACTANGLR